MVQKIGVAVAVAGLLAAARGEDNVVYKPLAFGGFSEFGQLVSGQYGENPAFENEWVDHFGAYIAQTALPSDNLAFDIGIGGVFEYQKREVVSAQWGGTQYKNFFVGPSVADIRYAAAARDGQGFGLQFGMFDYKYNPDANDLGEYLFRSGAYPGYITSGGFWFVNNAAPQLQALRAGYGRDRFKGDFFLITETSLPALYDISAAAVIGYKSEGGLLDLGAGANYKHLIPVKPSHTSPHVDNNAYFTKDGVTYTGSAAYYDKQAQFYQRRAAEVPADSAHYDSLAAVFAKTKTDVQTWMADPAANGIDPKYFTQQGLILMARASLDLKKLLASSAFGPSDMRLYTEAAILGVQNYPFYYENILDRIPVMFGFNVPTFRFLDLLSVQGEYYHSPYLNSYGAIVSDGSAVPSTPLGSNLTRSKTSYDDITKHDNFSWSILAKRVFGGGAFVSAQVARDHIRTVSIETWTAPEPTQVLGSPHDWYWMLQFGYGI